MDSNLQAKQEGENTIDFANFAESGSQLYSDFFSDPTRQRQGYLLTTAILVILISHSIIEFNQGSLGGVSFTIADQTVLIWSLRALCSYFIVAYLLSVLQDYQAFAFKEKLIRYKIYKFSKQVADKNIPIEDVVYEYVQDEWLQNEWRKTITSSVIEIASAASSPVTGALPLLKTISSFLRKEVPNRKAFEREKFSSGTIIETYKSFSLLRNVLEIGFPLILGLFALWFSFC